MIVEIIELTSLKIGDINYDTIIFRVGIADLMDIDRTNDVYQFLLTIVNGGVKKVIIDMEGLEFIDSQGIGAIIEITKLLRAENGDLVFINVPQRIEIIFKPINLQRFIKVFPAVNEAVHYLKFI